MVGLSCGKSLGKRALTGEGWGGIIQDRQQSSFLKDLFEKRGMGE
jgi:hypothetical protein